MAKSNFIKNFVNWIKSFDLKAFFRGFVNGDQSSANVLQETVVKSNQLVSNVLEWLKSPTADFITDVIPSDWDDNLKAKAVEALEKVTANYAAFAGCLDAPTVGEQLVCVYNKILELNDEDEEDSFKHKLAVLFSKIFADGKLTFSDAIIAAEFVFKLVTKKKANA